MGGAVDAEGVRNERIRSNVCVRVCAHVCAFLARAPALACRHTMGTQALCKPCTIRFCFYHPRIKHRARANVKRLRGVV
eukprot:566188-Pelagomonas_calceolata.AAC.3